MITRFAPSPTGPLHLGHAYAAWVACDMAGQQGGRCLLRIEDIDSQRSKPHWEAQIRDDLAWLGLHFEGTVLRQSDRLERYAGALAGLWDRGLIYPCTCTRRDIAEAARAPQEGAPRHGPDGPVYPGTCRGRPRGPGTAMPSETALRLDMARALETLDAVPRYTETGIAPPACAEADEIVGGIGDVVLSRRDFTGSYHLSVVLDDADQGVTHVTRGADLAEATIIHVILQRLLDLRVPVYHHHRLIRDAAGKRLAKRDDARALATYRADGLAPSDVWALLGVTPPAP